MKKPVLHILNQARQQRKKLLALLIDPDTPNTEELKKLIAEANAAQVDLIFMGGSLLLKDALEQCVEQVKALTDIPVVLFPGSVMQVNDKADAILFLSLISGRNPDLLIGNQVIAAPYLKQLDLEILPTGYMLVESGQATTASYMSGSLPIPNHKPEIAACTAMAGEMLGLKLIYLDGGSGAQIPVTETMIKQVRQAVDAPIIVGGGIKTHEKAAANCKAGADVIVVGNATETNPGLLREMAEAVHQS
jgi:putative glycerol-1-phosphate prenyltransferase